MGLSTAKATVSATAAGKNPNVSYTWQGARNHGANTMTGRTVLVRLVNIASLLRPLYLALS